MLAEEFFGCELALWENINAGYRADEKMLVMIDAPTRRSKSVEHQQHLLQRTHSARRLNNVNKYRSIKKHTRAKPFG